MKDNATPEEKLLNLIKKDTQDAEGPQKKQEDNKERPVASAPEAATRKRIPKIARQKVVRPFFAVNKILVIIFFCAIMYMVFIYLYSYKSKLQIPEKIKGGKVGNMAESAPKEISNFSHYADILSGRQLFKVYEIPKPKPTGPPKPKITLQQLLSGYTFVGIIFGDVPQAIVEERRTGQSFYLTAGQFLGEIKIEKLESGKITVSYEDETMDIRI